MKKISALFILIAISLSLNARNYAPAITDTLKEYNQEEFPVSQAPKYLVHPFLGTANNLILSTPYRDNSFHSPFMQMTKNYERNPNISPMYQYVVETGYTPGTDLFNIDLLKLNLVYAYFFTPGLSAGLGSGIRYALPVNDALVPVFADFRARIHTKNIPVYIAFDVGYALDITSDFNNQGWYFLMNPSAGVCFPLPSGPILHLGIGYDYQAYLMSESGYNVTPGATIHIVGLGINAGISF
jgi:hypothetical protein